MTRTISKIGLLVALGAAVVGGGVAFARHGGGWHGPERMKAHVTERIDDALEAAKASPAQKAAVYAARDHVFATMEESHGDHGADFARAEALFLADKLDPAQVQALRAEHEAQAQKIGDAVVQAVYDVHDALTQAVAAWARDHHAQHAFGPEHHRGAGIFKAMISTRVDEALTAAHVTDAQRVRLHGVRDRVFAAFEAAHQEDPSARIEQALTLFSADKLDGAKVQALRDDHMTQMKKIGDVVQGAITELHDTLTAPQRQALVEFVRAQHAEHMGHRMGHGAVEQPRAE
jgi:aspartate/tyrosine/aromatic aminotransferase